MSTDLCSFPTTGLPFPSRFAMFRIMTRMRIVTYCIDSQPTLLKIAIFPIEFYRLEQYIIVSLCVVFPFGEDAQIGKNRCRQ